MFLLLSYCCMCGEGEWEGREREKERQLQDRISSTIVYHTFYSSCGRLLCPSTGGSQGVSMCPTCLLYNW